MLEDMGELTTGIPIPNVRLHNPTTPRILPQDLTLPSGKPDRPGQGPRVV